MKWGAILVAKIAIVVAFGYALYMVSHLNKPSMPDWTASRLELSTGQPSRARSPDVHQRRAMAIAACESQTWPNVAPGCITRTFKARPRDIAPGATVVQPQLATSAPDFFDPSDTGSLTSGANQTELGKATRKASSLPRDTRPKLKSRAHADAIQLPRKVRWASAQQRWSGPGKMAPSSVVFARSWAPGHSWGN